MSDDYQNVDGETHTIPTLELMVSEYGESFATAALERVAANIDRELQDEFEKIVTIAVNDAVTLALTSYREKARALVLRELAAQLGPIPGSTDTEQR